MRVLGTVLMLICFTLTGLMGIGLLFVFPPLGIIGWSSWAARQGVNALANQQQTLNRIEANTRQR